MALSLSPELHAGKIRGTMFCLKYHCIPPLAYLETYQDGSYWGFYFRSYKFVTLTLTYSEHNFFGDNEKNANIPLTPSTQDVSQFVTHKPTDLCTSSVASQTPPDPPLVVTPFI